MQLEFRQTRSHYKLPTAITIQSVDGDTTMVLFPWGEFPDLEAFAEKAKTVLDASKEEEATRIFSANQSSISDDYIAEIFQWLFNQSKVWNKSEYIYGLDVFVLQRQGNSISFGSSIDGTVKMMIDAQMKTVWQKASFSDGEKVYLPTQCFGLLNGPKYQSGQILLKQAPLKIEIILGAGAVDKNRASWIGYLTTSSI